MFDKRKPLAIALTSTFICIAVISIFIDDGIFPNIVRGAVLPLLLFSFISAYVSVFDNVVLRYNHFIYEQSILKPEVEWNLEYAKKISKDVADSEDEELRIRWNTSLVECRQRLERINKTIKIYKNLIERIQARKTVYILYVVSLFLLLLFVMISPLIAPYLNCIELPVFALIALAITVFQALWSELLVEDISTRMYNKEIAREDTNDG